MAFDADEQSYFVVLSTDHPKIAPKLPKGGLAVHSFPFSIGRPPEEDEQAAATLVDLVIDDERPYWIARVQLTLMRDQDGIMLIDGSSVHGNVVNGEWIGPGQEREFLTLETGGNVIALGGADSPYRLSLEVKPYSSAEIAA